MKWQEKALLRPSEATSILVLSYKTLCLHMTSSLLGSGWAQFIIRINPVGALRKAVHQAPRNLISPDQWQAVAPTSTAAMEA